MKAFLTICLMAVSCLGFGDIAHNEKILKALDEGAKFLLSQQKEEGYWSDSQMPALTALPLWALSSLTNTPKEVIAKSAQFVIQTQRPDGGFYVPKPGRGGSGLGNYNTAVCLSALYESGATVPVNVLLKAREYIASSQLTGDDTMAGGFGYDKVSRRRYADLSNTSYALDAMRRTEKIEELRPGGQKVDVDWQKALLFVENLVKESGEDAGGAAYNDSTAQAGTTTNSASKVTLRAYGSMTYAAVLSMCHAQLTRDDPRVKQSLAYCTEHWSLDENPGMGRQGLYYYYNILSRALSVATVQDIGGHDWREELAQVLISKQQKNGSWFNDNNRFWEADPVLCTSFAMLTLKTCLKVEK